MSRVWITAQPSRVDVITFVNRNRLRRTYRLLRQTMSPWQARWVINDIVRSAQTEVKP